jgi:hypothetical protein
MRALQTRVRRLESRCGTTAPLPWEIPGWEQWSEAEQMQVFEQYIAAHPQSRLARKWRAIETYSDRELEELLAAAHTVLDNAGIVIVWNPQYGR